MSDTLKARNNGWWMVVDLLKGFAEWEVEVRVITHASDLSLKFLVKIAK
jgi:hypothetical protein